MNVNSDTTKTYRDQILDFRKLSLECIPVLTETGKLIQSTFSGKSSPPRWAIFCHDMVKRIRENIQFLTDSKPPQNGNSNPLQLIIRSIFSDLLSLSYVVVNLNNLSEVNSFLNHNDMEAYKGLHNYIVCESEFISKFDDDNLKTLFKKKIQQLEQSRADISHTLGSKKDKKDKINTVSEIADFFKRNNDLRDLYILLFGPFKLLSQVEHYAIVNRHFSYYEDNLSLFFKIYAISYKSVIDEICAKIKSQLR